MKTIRSAFGWAATCIVALIALCSFSFAFASADPAMATPAQSAAVWAPLIAAGLALLAFAIRKFAPDLSWLHGAWGAWAIAFLVGLLGALADALRAGWSLTNLIPAVTTFVTSFIATANPSATKDGELKTSGAKMLLPLVFLGLTLSVGACAGGKVLGQCELAKLPSTLSSFIASVASIASQPAGYVADLEGLGKQILPDQVDCIALALAAEATKPGHPTWRGQMADHLHEYLAKRRAAGAKSACAPELQRATRREARAVLQRGEGIYTAASR